MVFLSSPSCAGVAAGLGLLTWMAAGCSPASPEPEPAPVGARGDAPVPTPASTPARPAAEGGGKCTGISIRRAGLSESPECADAAAKLVEAPSADRTCQTDGDCQIFAAAGGCLATNLRADAQVDPLPAACFEAAPCANTSFDDHRFGCRDGCCTIFEE